MPSIKHIKRRIVSVKGTKQIVKAMNLVAAAKLQKCKQRLDAVREMFTHIQSVMQAVGAHEGCEDNVFFKKREPKTSAYVIISSDRGLCGGYNVNLAKEALRFIAENNKDGKKREIIITAGTRGMQYFRRRGKWADHKFAGPTEDSISDMSHEIGEMLCDMYLKHEIDEAYIIFTKFKSVLSYEPEPVRLLPIGAADENTQTSKKRMIFDPDVDGFLSEAVPLYVNKVLSGAMIESSVCEEAARMISMEAANKNAVDIIDDLTLVFNRTRQGIITQELTEIVSGANALQ